MPDQLAHFIFARQVAAACSPALRRRFAPHSAAFRMGSFGPDPVFNDPSPLRRAEAIALHRLPGRLSLDRLREAVREDAPHAAAFAAGYFCHYAMDRLFHPHILALASGGEARHIAIETAYDRELCLRHPEWTPRKFRPDAAELAAAARVYLLVSPAQLGRDIQAFWQIKRFVHFAGGTAIAPAVGTLLPRLRGFIPYRQPSPAIRCGIEMMDEMMHRHIPEAAAQLEACFDAFAANAPLPAWTEADFSGRFAAE